MATLYLRNIPEDVNVVLTSQAESRGTSKNRRAIEALRRGLGLDQVERSRLVKEIRAGRRPVAVNPAEIIREERPGRP